MEALQNIDTELFTFLNGLHSGYFDQLMWLLSSKFSSALMIVALIYILLHKGWKQAGITILAIALVILFADQMASGIIKHLVERPRPTHEPALINIVHTVNDYKGGPFGFVSSHAANMFGLSMLLCLMIRSRWMWISMMFWAVIVSYSRIYLGVHYPGDVLGGAIVGIVMAVIVYFIWRWVQKRYFSWQDGRVFDKKDARILSTSVGVNCVLLAILAAVFCF